MMNNLDVYLQLRIDPETKMLLANLAKENERSMSATVRYLIRKEYDQRSTTDKPAARYAAE
ncbi:ribbon-helix-helix protein, CopG family [bacterium]|nr:ribbon-helix-helix protein, CopG family [bacterium]